MVCKEVQRTGINTEAKYLLLKYALEDLQCIAVEFRTHILNQTSRRTIGDLVQNWMVFCVIID